MRSATTTRRPSSNSDRLSRCSKADRESRNRLTDHRRGDGARRCRNTWMRRLRERSKRIGLLVEPAALFPGLGEHLPQRDRNPKAPSPTVGTETRKPASPSRKSGRLAVLLPSVAKNADKMRDGHHRSATHFSAFSGDRAAAANPKGDPRWSFLCRRSTVCGYDTIAGSRKVGRLPETRTRGQTATSRRITLPVALRGSRSRVIRHTVGTL